MGHCSILHGKCIIRTPGKLILNGPSHLYSKFNSPWTDVLGTLNGCREWNWDNHNKAEFPHFSLNNSKHFTKGIYRFAHLNNSSLSALLLTFHYFDENSSNTEKEITFNPQPNASILLKCLSAIEAGFADLVGKKSLRQRFSEKKCLQWGVQVFFDELSSDKYMHNFNQFLDIHLLYMFLWKSQGVWLTRDMYFSALDYVDFYVHLLFVYKISKWYNFYLSHNHQPTSKFYHCNFCIGQAGLICQPLDLISIV